MKFLSRSLFVSFILFHFVSAFCEDNVAVPLFIIVGPSGAGKTTIIKELIARGQICWVPTTTTRPIRPHEEAGIDYFFMSVEDFLKNKDSIFDPLFLKGNWYGFNLNYLCDIWSKSYKPVLTATTLQTALLLKEKYNNVYVFFVSVDDNNAYEILAQRMRMRGETEAFIDVRLSTLTQELQNSVLADYVFINHELMQTVDEIIEKMNHCDTLYTKINKSCASGD